MARWRPKVALYLDDREVADAAVVCWSQLSEGITGQHGVANCGEIMA